MKRFISLLLRGLTIKLYHNNNYCLINEVEPVCQASTNQDNAKKKNNDFAEILKIHLKKEEASRHGNYKGAILVRRLFTLFGR